jgi:hypothetical protein
VSDGEFSRGLRRGFGKVTAFAIPLLRLGRVKWHAGPRGVGGKAGAGARTDLRILASAARAVAIGPTGARLARFADSGHAFSTIRAVGIGSAAAGVRGDASSPLFDSATLYPTLTQGNTRAEFAAGAVGVAPTPRIVDGAPALAVDARRCRRRTIGVARTARLTNVASGSAPTASCTA